MNSIFQVLTLAWTLQGGQYFNNGGVYAGMPLETTNNYFTEVSFELRVPLSFKKDDGNNIFVGTDTEEQFFPAKIPGFYFSPWQDTFVFNAGIRVFGIELGFKHECVHPIWFSPFSTPSQSFSSYDKIYAKVSGVF